MILPGQTLESLQKQPQYVRRFLSVCPRQPLFSAIVSGAPVKDPQTQGVIELNYTSGVGSLSVVKVGMTMDIGTFSGGRDVGSVRLRKAPTSNKFFIGEVGNDLVKVEAGHFLTVRDEFLPWQKPPRLVGVMQDQDYFTDFTEYHDYDIAYGTQNQNIAPLANIYSGLHANGYKLPVKYAGFANPTTGKRSVVLTGAYSYTPVGSINAYLWNVADGTIVTGNTTTAQITVEFDPTVTTFRYISLRVTNTLGATHTKYFPIWSYLDNSVYMPMLAPNDFRITSDTTETGREMELVVTGGTLSFNDFPQWTSACVWEDARFGTDDIPPMYIDQFYGWMVNDGVTLKIDGTSEYRVKVAGTAPYMALINTFAQTLNDTGQAPTRWFQMQNITFPKVVLYALREYTTFLDLINVEMFDPSYLLGKKITIKKGSVWEQITDISSAVACVDSVRSDSYGTLWFRKQYQLLSETEREAINPLCTLDNSFWPNESAPEYVEIGYETVGVVTGTGTNYSGTAETVYKSEAPQIPSEGTGSDSLPFQYLPTTEPQSTLNAYTGHFYAWKNNPQPSQQFVLFDNFHALEPAWGVPFMVTWAGGDIRNLNFSLRYIPKSVSIQHNYGAGERPKVITVTAERDTIGKPGRTVEVGGGSGSGACLYTLSCPQGIGNLAAFTDTNQLFIRSDWESDSGVWASPIDLVPLFGGNSEELITFIVDAFSPKYLSTGNAVNGWILKRRGLWRITNIFSDSRQASEMLSTTGLNTTDLGSMQFERGVQNWGVFFKSGTPNLIVATTDSTNFNVYNLPTNNGGQFVRTPGVHVSPHTPGKAFVYGPQTAQTLDYGVTWTPNTPALTNGSWFPFEIHVPYQAHGDEVIYYGFSDSGGLEPDGALRLRKFVSGVNSDVTPTYSGFSHGPIYQFGVKTADDNMDCVLLVGFRSIYNNEFGATLDFDNHLFISRNGGGTWTRIPLVPAVGSEAGRYATAGNWGGQNKVFVWGTSGLFAYSADGGTTFKDRTIPDTLARIVNICGG